MKVLHTVAIFFQLQWTYCIDVCQLPSETGVCPAYIERYFFNTKTQRCEKFVYGGCGGNENNFVTMNDCEKRCDKKDCEDLPQNCDEYKYLCDEKPQNLDNPCPCGKKTMEALCPKTCGFCSKGYKRRVFKECSDGDTKTADDGCNSCNCINGGWTCTMMACPSLPPKCSDGDTKTADDGCNSCNCINGGWTCTMMACPSLPPNCHMTCTPQYAPVCGSDGKTYLNECALLHASCKNPGDDITLSYEGECVEDVCPRDWVLLDSRCLYFSSQSVKWRVALKRCEKMEAQLASIRDPEVVLDYVNQHFDGSSFWLGGNDLQETDTWRWQSGDKIQDNFPWGKGRPLGERQHCMVLRHFQHTGRRIPQRYMYVDNRCKNKWRYICEIPSKI